MQGDKFPSLMTIDFFFAILGVYACFLTWGITQERVSTTAYGADGNKFKYFIFLNFIQSLVASFIGFLYSLLTRQSLQQSPKLRNKYIQCALIHSLASPFGYASLKHIDYPTMILGKSCKLVPVMLMNFVIYRKTFPAYKYAVVALITLGVSMFMLLHSQETSGSSTGNSLLGLGLLTMNLLLDGTTNSTQDRIFSTFKVSGSHMMVFMNFYSCIFMLLYLVLYPWTNELSAAWLFCTLHPRVITDILIFSVTGALGQLFIFYTLQHYGSLSLVTITVTRKMFSIILSVVWFGHSLGWTQWLAVLIVFLGIGLEGYFARLEKQKLQRTKMPKVDSPNRRSARLKSK